MSGNSIHSPRLGLVDHDRALRHALLGYHQLFTAALLVIHSSVSFLLGKTFAPRQLVFPTVMLLCLIAQNRLWKAGRDQAATHFLVGGLLAATAVSLGVNGIYAPAVIVPVVSTLLAGYLLGGTAAWGYGAASLAMVWLSLGAHALGWTFRTRPPEHIWFGILVVMLLMASVSLFVLLRGLRSAALLQDRERDSLASVAQVLRQRQVELESDVRQRTRELELANAELSEFSHAVSHDLQGPLRSVRRFSEIISESVHDEPRQKLLEDITKHADAMEAVLERSLSRSRPRTGE